MAEELEKLQARAKLSARGASTFLFVAMGMMAVWGWTPLKAGIPAVYVLGAFLICVLLSVALSMLTMFWGVKVTHMKARIEDK